MNERYARDNVIDVAAREMMLRARMRARARRVTRVTQKSAHLFDCRFHTYDNNTDTVIDEYYERCHAFPADA